MNTKKLDGSFNIEINGMPYNTVDGDKYYEKTKKLYETNPELFEIEEIKETTNPIYSDLRQIEYGSIENQLDMIYWDKINGTNNWTDFITNIKNKYPKN